MIIFIPSHMYTGLFPTEIIQLTNLVTLDLSYTGLSGRHIVIYVSYMSCLLAYFDVFLYYFFNNVSCIVHHL